MYVFWIAESEDSNNNNNKILFCFLVCHENTENFLFTQASKGYLFLVCPEENHRFLFHFEKQFLEE